MMKKINAFTLLVCLTLLGTSLQAQEQTKKLIAALPEMETGKVYDGQDVRKAQKKYPEGFNIENKGNDVYYPFAKITGRKVIVVLYFKAEQEGEIVYMHAVALRKKTFQNSNIHHYVFSDGKIGSTTYKSTVSIDKKGVVSFDVSENDKQEVSRYKISGKRFDFIDKK